MRTKPLMIGYQQLRTGDCPDALVNAERVLAAFADREGYALGRIYVERLSNAPHSGLVAMLGAIRRGGVAAVGVPSAADLGRIPRVEQIMRNLLEREGTRVLIAQPLSTHNSAHPYPCPTPRSHLAPHSYPNLDPNPGDHHDPHPGARSGGRPCLAPPYPALPIPA